MTYYAWLSVPDYTARNLILRLAAKFSLDTILLLVMMTKSLDYYPEMAGI